jgi:hypothetical protein
MVDDGHPHVNIVSLLHQDHYTAEELAELLDMDVHFVQHEAFTGHLKATIAEHHVICINREAVVEWLRTRQLPLP